MSITDELRGYAQRYKNSYDAWSGIGDDLDQIADRIDAEHERKVEEVASGWDYWESTHVKLPVDADGEVIHGGDVMVKPDNYDNRLFTVGGMTLYGDQWSVQGFEPHKLRHHAPTVDNVLREFADIVRKERVELATISDDTIAEFAAKLRLAGDAE